MIISHDLKFIFISNGKTGTSSIEAILNKYQSCHELDIEIPGLFAKKHIPPRLLKSLIGNKLWNQYFKFCFVRNPWDWFVSQYFHNYKPGKIRKKEIILNPVGLITDIGCNARRKEELRNTLLFSKEQIMSLYYLLRRYRGVFDADSLFQYNYVYDEEDSFMMDFVGRFERLDEDFNKIKRILNIDTSECLPVANQNKHKPYQSYYTPETRDLIQTLYQIDIQTFNYTFSQI